MPLPVSSLSDPSNSSLLPSPPLQESTFAHQACSSQTNLPSQTPSVSPRTLLSTPSVAASVEVDQSPVSLLPLSSPETELPLLQQANMPETIVLSETVPSGTQLSVDMDLAPSSPPGPSRLSDARLSQAADDVERQLARLHNDPSLSPRKPPFSLLHDLPLPPGFSASRRDSSTSTIIQNKDPQNRIETIVTHRLPE